jgi:hypothetical protein
MPLLTMSTRWALHVQAHDLMCLLTEAASSTTIHHWFELMNRALPGGATDICCLPHYLISVATPGIALLPPALVTANEGYNYLTAKLVFVPIYGSGHFFLIILDRTTATALIIDSLGDDAAAQREHTHFRPILAAMNDERAHHGLPVEDYHVQFNAPDMPTQLYTDNICGPLVCAFAYYYMRHRTLPTTAHFTRRNHYAFRLGIFASLLDGSLPQYPSTIQSQPAAQDQLER